MNVETVSYLYSLQEFYALLRLTGSESVPFFPQDESMLSPGLESLEKSLLISRRSGTITADKVTGFLAKSVGQCDACLCLSGEGVFLGLFAAASVTVLLYLQRDRWVLTPFPDYSQALERMEDTVPRSFSTAELCLQIGGEKWRRPCNRENVLALIRQASEWMQSRERPSGEEAHLWKP